MSNKCITFPMNSHPRGTQRTEAQLRAELALQKAILAGHLKQRPGTEDLNLLAKWVCAKDRILTEIGLIEGQIENRWREVTA
jgi:hypothetical protein